MVQADGLYLLFVSQSAFLFGFVPTLHALYIITSICSTVYRNAVDLS